MLIQSNVAQYPKPAVKYLLVMPCNSLIAKQFAACQVRKYIFLLKFYSNCSNFSFESWSINDIRGEVVISCSFCLTTNSLQPCKVHGKPLTFVI
jgi:hypothetical protein